MKTELSKKLLAFIVTIMMFSGLSEFTNAQTCNGNKILVCKAGCGFICSQCIKSSQLQNYLNQGWHICHPQRLSANEMIPDGNIINIFPNPVSNSTTISFSLSQSQNISFKIFDVNGRLIKVLADNVFEKGEYQIQFNAEKIDAGIYFLKMQSTEFSKTEKLIISK